MKAGLRTAGIARRFFAILQIGKLPCKAGPNRTTWQFANDIDTETDGVDLVATYVADWAGTLLLRHRAGSLELAWD
jgi:hypothetical protein